MSQAPDQVSPDEVKKFLQSDESIPLNIKPDELGLAAGPAEEEKKAQTIVPPDKALLSAVSFTAVSPSKFFVIYHFNCQPRLS